MPVINKTITQSSIDLNALNSQILELSNKIDSLDSAQLNKAEIYNTETERDTDNPTPTNDDWCYVTASENPSYLGQVVLYKYSNGWTFITAISYINDATTTTKGVIQLSGDLTGTSSNPVLKSITTGGIYSFGNNTVTVNSKGLISNVINATASYEWIYYSNSTTNVRSVDTKTLTVPSYNLSSANLIFVYNGSIIPEPNNFTRFNSTTITTNFIINKTDDIMIINLKFVGSLDSSAIINDLSQDNTTTYSSSKLESDFAKLTESIIFKTDKTYDIGSATNSCKDGYFYNSPIITSMRSKKRDIEDNELGLEFINGLISRTYKMIDGQRCHKGFIADESKYIMDLFGVDFGLYIKDENGNEALRYEELIPILCKAIQDLTPWYKKIYYKISKYIKERKCKND